MNCCIQIKFCNFGACPRSRKEFFANMSKWKPCCVMTRLTLRGKMLMNREFAFCTRRTRNVMSFVEYFGVSMFSSWTTFIRYTYLKSIDLVCFEYYLCVYMANACSYHSWICNKKLYFIVVNRRCHLTTHDCSGNILILGHEVKGSKPFTGKIGFLFLSHGST